MGLLDKLKNAFFEEEYVEVDDNEEVAKKVESKKEVKKEEKIKTEEIKNRTKLEEDIDEEIEEINEIIPEIKEEVKEEPVISDRELVNKNNKIEYFNDSDFVSNDYYREEKKPASQAYGGAYSKVTYTQTTSDKKAYNRPYGASNDKGFQPTPIISPIYGVLDKNYHKDEVIDKKDRPSSYVSKKNVDLDSIRQKAYGMSSLNDLPDYDDIVSEKEVEEDINYKEEPLLKDMVEEKKPVVDTVSIEDAEQYFEDLGLEYNVDYKDAGYEKATGRRTAIHDYDDDKTQEIIINNNIDKEDSPVEDEEDSELLENNLFDLVDSMYNGDEE